MEVTAPPTLHEWEAFYVIVGSSAGALTGLQFVVLTLITEAGLIRDSGEALSAFGSPNVVHFCTALLVSALLSAPWHGSGAPAIAVALTGIGGCIYTIAVMRRALRQSGYKPVLEDWMWHGVLPFAAYASQVYSGVQLVRGSVDALFLVGASVLLLVFVGIHNSWDTVMYVTVERARSRKARVDPALKAAVSPAPPPPPPSLPLPPLPPPA